MMKRPNETMFKELSEVLLTSCDESNATAGICVDD